MKADGVAGSAALTVVNALLVTMADGQEPFRGWFTVDDRNNFV